MKAVDPKKLFRIRKEVDSNQMNFALKIPIPYKTYAAKEKSGKFSSTEIKKIAALLKCDPDDFMTDVVDPTQATDLSTLRATVRVLLLLVTELKMKDSGKTLVEVTQDIEAMIKKERG